MHDRINTSLLEKWTEMNKYPCNSTPTLIASVSDYFSLCLHFLFSYFILQFGMTDFHLVHLCFFFFYDILPYLSLCVYILQNCKLNSSVQVGQHNQVSSYSQALWFISFDLKLPRRRWSNETDAVLIFNGIMQLYGRWTQIHQLGRDKSVLLWISGFFICSGCQWILTN